MSSKINIDETCISPSDHDPILTELLQKKGMLEMVVEIGKNGSRRNTELRNELLLSSSTIQKRLKSGKQISIWEQALEDRKAITAKVYKLTPLGEAIYQSAVENNLDDLYKKRREINRVIDNHEARLPPVYKEATSRN